MENRKQKHVTDIIKHVEDNYWKLTLQEFDVLESVLDVFQARNKKEIDKIEHLVNDETESLLKSLNDREVINYVTENWNFIASDDEGGLEEALDDLNFNWSEKVSDIDMIESLENDGWNVTMEDTFKINNIVGELNFEEITDLFLDLSPQKQIEAIELLKTL